MGASRQTVTTRRNQADESRDAGNAAEQRGAGGSGVVPGAPAGEISLKGYW